MGMKHENDTVIKELPCGFVLVVNGKVVDIPADIKKGDHTMLKKVEKK